MQAIITEIGRDDAYAYGVAFYICRNAEVIAAGTIGEADESGNGWEGEAAEAFEAATAAVTEAGYDYEPVSDFRAYNGGPRKGLVESAWFRAEILEETEDEAEDFGEWEPIWLAGLGAADVPAHMVAAVGTIESAASGAMFDTMTAAAKAAEESRPTA